MKKNEVYLIGFFAQSSISLFYNTECNHRDNIS